jgi:hypothetical protein
MNKGLLIFFSFIISLITCSPLFADVSEAVHVLQGDEQYSPISIDRVKVYAFKPDFKFKVIGEIEAHGRATPTVLQELDIISALTDNGNWPGEKEDMELAMSALKRETAEIGADGVIIVKQNQVNIGNGETERRIVGAAIRIEPEPIKYQQQFKDGIKIGLGCQTSLDCPNNLSCRSVKGGGTECR